MRNGGIAVPNSEQADRAQESRHSAAQSLDSDGIQAGNGAQGGEERDSLAQAVAIADPHRCRVLIALPVWSPQP